MPIDGHGVLALIAPRAAAIAHGWTDHEGDLVFADEMALKAAAEVYSLLEVNHTHKRTGSWPSNLRTISRPGDHHGYDSIHSYFDWFDRTFGRLTAGFRLAYTSSNGGVLAGAPYFEQTFLTAAGFSWDVWKEKVHDNEALTPSTAMPDPSAPLEERVGWLLQLKTPIATNTKSGKRHTEKSIAAGKKRTTYEGKGFSMGSNYAENSGSFDYVTKMLHRDAESADPSINRLPVSFGDYVSANLYWRNSTPAAAPAAPAPAVIWLHPFSYATGYSAPTGKSAGQANVWLDLVNQSRPYVVLAYDQVGFATRLREGGNTFYARYGGRASLLGHMVKDASAAVDFLHCQTAAGRASGRCHDGAARADMPQAPLIDPERIYVAGYSLGGMVALHLAALDQKRVAGSAAFAGFTPFRTDLPTRSTGGIRRLYEMHALAPRLGLFDASHPANRRRRDEPRLNQSAIPYDWDELIASIAPRPCLLYTPTEDRDATYADVERAVATAAEAWAQKGAAEKLVHAAPASPTGMGRAEMEALAGWLARVAARDGI
eukprot:g248.t1